jgi:hypothetical protein
MTPEQIEEYKALLAAATQGMWQAEGKEIWRRTDEHGAEFYAGAVWITDVEHEGNRNLIAAAPKAIYDLLAALEEAEQRVAEEKKWRDVEHEVAAVYHRELIEAQQTIARQEGTIKYKDDAVEFWMGISDRLAEACKYYYTGETDDGVQAYDALSYYLPAIGETQP